MFDIGANEGQTTRILLDHVDGCVVHAVEPFPDPYRELHRGYGTHPRVVLHELALSDSSGRIDVPYRAASRYTHSLSTSTNLARGANDCGQVEIRTDTLDNLCRAQEIERIEFLKIDVEGHEMAVLRGGESMLQGRRVDSILAEATFDRSSRTHTPFRDLDDHLHARGFQVAGIHHRVALVPSRPKWGSYCDVLWLHRDLFPT